MSQGQIQEMETQKFDTTPILMQPCLLSTSGCSKLESGGGQVLSDRGYYRSCGKIFLLMFLYFLQIRIACIPPHIHTETIYESIHSLFIWAKPQNLLETREFRNILISIHIVMCFENK